MLIQLGHPKINSDGQITYKYLKHVFGRLFRNDEESVYVFWHDIPLRFRYREDLYHNFDNILAMVWLIQRDEHGATKVSLMNQLLSMEWEIRWEKELVSIRSTFVAHDDLYEPYAQALNQYTDVQMPRTAFLSEWKTLLHQIIVAFRSGQVQIQDGTERRKWEMLQRTEELIPNYGRLYTRPT